MEPLCGKERIFRLLKVPVLSGDRVGNREEYKCV